MSTIIGIFFIFFIVRVLIELFLTFKDQKKKKTVDKKVVLKKIKEFNKNNHVDMKNICLIAYYSKNMENPVEVIDQYIFILEEMRKNVDEFCIKENIESIEFYINYKKYLSDISQAVNFLIGAKTVHQSLDINYLIDRNPKTIDNFGGNILH